MENPTSRPPDVAPVRLLPLGDAAVIVEFGTTIDLPTHHTIQAFCAYLDHHPFPGLLEYVPAFATVTVYYNILTVSVLSDKSSYDYVADMLRSLLEEVPKNTPLPPPEVVEIPVCYGGRLGPDLEWVAAHNRLTAKEVIELHALPDYVVYMIGFAPGFPYLGGLDEHIAAPRRDKPRPRVPAGSVGIAGRQTGVYSLPTPGGWQLIGRTPLRLFDPHRETPTLLRTGQYVRFVPISEQEFERRQEYEY